MTTTNNEPNIKELAHMNIQLDMKQVGYWMGYVTHKTITWDDIGKNKKFYIERAKYLAIEKDAQDFDCGYFMSEELKNDIDFAKQLIPLHGGYAHWFSANVRKDKEVIKLILKHCEPSQWIPGGYNCKILAKENRLEVAYEIIKEFPEYEQLLGATIKKKIGSMGLVEYIEKKNLQNSLKKNLTKDNKPAMRMKI